MLSGERRIARDNGIPPAMNKPPAISAARRQPNCCTAMASSGVISAPPTGTAALTTVMARARSLMNQLLATTVGAWTKPALNASEMTPR